MSLLGMDVSFHIWNNDMKFPNFSALLSELMILQNQKTENPLCCGLIRECPCWHSHCLRKPTSSLTSMRSLYWLSCKLNLARLLLKRPNIIHVQADMVEYHITCAVLYFLYLAIINTRDKMVCVSAAQGIWQAFGHTGIQYYLAWTFWFITIYQWGCI